MSDAFYPLIKGVAAKDKAAFSALYRALERSVFAFVMSKLNDSFESADILHETFLEVWRSADKFEGRSTVKTWIFGIAYRKMIDVMRKKSKLTVSDELPEQIDDSPDAERAMTALQAGEHLKGCLDDLKGEFQTAIRLAFYDDLSYREIAEVTGVPEGTVKTRVYHAKQALLHCLDGRLTPQDI